MKKKHITVVSPVYNASRMLTHLVCQISNSISLITDSFEIILVDDGSSDDSWAVIESICESNESVKGVQLSRNFGQHNAIHAGLTLSSGEWIVVMDCDLQDRPDQIPLLYEQAIKGYDIVFARRSIRADNIYRRVCSNVYYSIFGYLTNTSQDAALSSFGIYNRASIDAVLSMKDYHKSFLTMIQWVGYKSCKINVMHSARMSGKSTYSLSRLVRLALNLSIAYSDKPLKIVAFAGITISAVSIAIAFAVLLAFLLGLVKVPGYTSLILSIWMTTGLTIFVLGVVGLYLGKTFEASKGRPVFITRRIIN